MHLTSGKNSLFLKKRFVGYSLRNTDETNLSLGKPCLLKGIFSGTQESVGIAPCPFKKLAVGAEVPFHNSTIGHFMVHENLLETHVLQPFAHPEWYSIIYVIFLRSNIVTKQNQAYNRQRFFVFYKFALPSILLLPYQCYGVTESFHSQGSDTTILSEYTVYFASSSCV